MKKIKTKKEYIVYILLEFSLIIFIIFTILMMPTTSILMSSSYNIIDFQFLWSYENYQQVMSTWSSTEISAAKENTFFDFGWLIGYGGLLFSLNIILSKTLIKKVRKLVFFGGLASVMAASFDVLENILTLYMLYKFNFVYTFIPLCVSIIAMFKFILIGYAIISVLIGLGSVIYKKLNN